MTVEGANRLTVSDILIGEVWVGSGQSNMEWPVERVNAAEKEMAAAAYPKIRLFKVENDTAHAPLTDVKGSWQLCTPESVKNFSAVAYFFARDLHQKTGLPFGAIQAAWGGTPAQAWVSPSGMAADPWFIRFRLRWARALETYPDAMKGYEYARKTWEAEAEKTRRAGKEPRPGPREPMGPLHPHQPSALFNAMIAPLTPFAIRGALWYQGENNAENADGFEYRHLFRTLIEDWRTIPASVKTASGPSYGKRRRWRSVCGIPAWRSPSISANRSTSTRAISRTWAAVWRWRRGR
jgi:sialate O-acetylesterase